MPKGYFDAAGERLVNKFREDLPTGHGSDNSEELMDAFPNDALARTLQRTWLSAAIAIYRNWLSYIVSKKTGVSKLSRWRPYKKMSSETNRIAQSQQGTCPK